MIGASTSFYGYYGKTIEEKVKKLINIFKGANIQPYIQIGAGKNNTEYNKLVKKLNAYRNNDQVVFTIHQSIWLPSDDFYINIASSDKQVKESSINCIKKNIDFARDIDIRNISFHGGYATDRLSQAHEFAPLDSHNSITYEEAYNNSINSLEILKDYAGKEIKLSIENFNYRPERRYLYSQVNDFEKLPKDIGVILNIGHLYYTEKKLKINSYTDEMINSVRDRIHEMHINDNDGTEDLHKLVGKGDIPIRDIIKKVSKGRDTPHLIIEAHKSRHEYSDNDLIENILELNRIAKV